MKKLIASILTVIMIFTLSAGLAVSAWADTGTPACAESGRHVAGDWTLTQMASYDEPTQIKETFCIYCGTPMEKKTYTLTGPERQKAYEDECPGASYAALLDFPEDNEGKRFRFGGYIIQELSKAEAPDEYSTYLVATKNVADEVVCLNLKDYDTPQKYGDYLTFFGEYEGLYRYTNLLGNNKSVPEITAHHFYEIDGAKTHPSESLIEEINQAVAVHEELYGFPLPAYRFYGLPDCLAQLEE